METTQELISPEELENLTRYVREFNAAERALAKIASSEARIKSQKLAALSNYDLTDNVLDDNKSTLTSIYGEFSHIDLESGTIIRK